MVSKDDREDRMRLEANATDIFPADSTVPAPVKEYIASLGTTVTPQADIVRINIPEIGLPSSGGDAAAGTFGPKTAQTHNVYECYVSPFVTRRYIEETVAFNTVAQYAPDWVPLSAGFIPIMFQQRT